MLCERVILFESRRVGMSCITREQKYIEDFLFKNVQFFANFNEGRDGFVQMFLFMGGG